MKTYKIHSHADKVTYSVSLDETGVVETDGLSDNLSDLLKHSVERHMTKRGLSAIMALGLAVGPYSTVTEADEAAVSDQTPPVEVP